MKPANKQPTGEWGGDVEFDPALSWGEWIVWAIDHGRVFDPAERDEYMRRLREERKRGKKKK